MSTATTKFDAQFDCADSVTFLDNSAEQWAGLFAPDAEVREGAIAAIAQEGEKAVPCLAQIVQRPLAYALDCWPEWQDMLPAQAILARSLFGRRAALQAMICIGRPAFCELTRLLHNPEPNLREYAADALRQMDAPEAIDALRTSLAQELANHRQGRRKWNQKRMLVSVGAMLLILLLTPVYSSLPLYGYFFAPVCGLIAWLLSRFTDRGAGVRRTAVAALAETGDKRHIGLLTNCLNDPNHEVRHSVSNALTQLLPEVRIQDKADISRAERTALLRTLDGDNPALAVAVLTAMQHIGDEQILRQVAFVIDSPVHHDAVREAAHECLPHVKLRIKEAQESQVLLRSASGQKEGAACLLRPLREQPASDHEEQLLRPHENN